MIIELLHQTFPGLEKLFKNRYSKIALNIIEEYAHPDLVSQKDIESLTSSIMEYTNKNLSYQKAENYAERLNKIAQESYPNVKHSSFLVKKFDY